MLYNFSGLEATVIEQIGQSLFPKARQHPLQEFPQLLRVFWLFHLLLLFQSLSHRFSVFSLTPFPFRQKMPAVLAPLFSQMNVFLLTVYQEKGGNFTWLQLTLRSPSHILNAGKLTTLLLFSLGGLDLLIQAE